MDSYAPSVFRVDPEPAGGPLEQLEVESIAASGRDVLQCADPRAVESAAIYATVLRVPRRPRVVKGRLICLEPQRGASAGP
jgi:hypothetical protein